MRDETEKPERRGWQRWWPFLLLCALKGSRWIFSEALPGSGSSVATEALGCGSAAVLFLWLARRQGGLPAEGSQIVRSMLGGALLIAGPLLALIVPAAVSTASIAMALALTPVVLAVLDSSARGSGNALPGRLWPGLAAVAGLLLLLAEPSLASPGADLLLVAMPVLTGCGAALFCGAKQGAGRMPYALLGGAGVFGLALLVSFGQGQGVAWPSLHGLATALDGVEALLCVLALDRIAAARWSAQFAVVPLLVLVEGVALLHSPMAMRFVVGLLLLAAASIALLAPPSEEPRLGLGVVHAEAPRTE